MALISLAEYAEKKEEVQGKSGGRQLQGDSKPLKKSGGIGSSRKMNRILTIGLNLGNIKRTKENQIKPKPQYTN